MGRPKEIDFDCRRAAPLARFCAALLEDPEDNHYCLVDA